MIDSLMFQIETRRPKQASLKQKLNEKFIEWCKNTTNHGIPKIVSDRNQNIRLMWALCFIANLLCCTYVITMSLIDYYKYKTTIAIHHYQDQQAILPAITICNMNPFKINYVMKYFKNNPVGFSKYDECIRNSANWKTCFNINETDQINYYSRAFRGSIANDKRLYHNQTKFSFTLKDDMFVSCLYNLNTCSADNFTQFWSNVFGNCYTFGDGIYRPVLKTSGTGSFLGLRLEVIVSPPNSKTRHDFKTGLILMIHNQSDLPFAPITQNYGIQIPTGYETYIGITRKVIKKLESPYSDCIKDLTPFSPESEKIFGYFRELNLTYYDQDFCFTLCYQDKLIDKCGCLDIGTPTIRNASYCYNMTQIMCLFPFFSKFLSSETNICKRTCRKECFKIEFEIEKNMVRFPSTNYLNYLYSHNRTKHRFPADKKNLVSFAKKSFLSLMVNYKSIEYTVIEENAQMTFETLLGSIGGQLGLFIGISVLSCIEVIELITEFVIIFYKYRKRRN